MGFWLYEIIGKYWNGSSPDPGLEGGNDVKALIKGFSLVWCFVTLGRHIPEFSSISSLHSF